MRTSILSSFFIAAARSQSISGNNIKTIKEEFCIRIREPDGSSHSVGKYDTPQCPGDVTPKRCSDIFQTSVREALAIYLYPDKEVYFTSGPCPEGEGEVTGEFPIGLGHNLVLWDYPKNYTAPEKESMNPKAIAPEKTEFCMYLEKNDGSSQYITTIVPECPSSLTLAECWQATETAVVEHYLKHHPDAEGSEFSFTDCTCPN